MESKPASKEYLASLVPRQVITVYCGGMGEGYTQLDWVSRILVNGIETGKGGWYSKKTGYNMGAGAPEVFSYITEPDGR